MSKESAAKLYINVYGRRHSLFHSSYCLQNLCFQTSVRHISKILYNKHNVSLR